MQQHFPFESMRRQKRNPKPIPVTDVQFNEETTEAAIRLMACALIAVSRRAEEHDDEQ